MPLLIASSVFGLGRRHWSSQQCCLHRLHTVSTVCVPSLTYLINRLLWSEKSQLCISPRTVVFISMAIVTRSLEHGLCTLTAVSAFGRVIIINGDGGCGWQQSNGGLAAQISWLGLRVGGHLALSVHSSSELVEVWQWLQWCRRCHKDCHKYYHCYCWHFYIFSVNEPSLLAVMQSFSWMWDQLCHQRWCH